MKSFFQRYSSLITLIGLALLAVIMLLLLSWGISTSNLAAAMASGAVLALDIVISGSLVMAPDDLRSQATERTLRLASSTLSHMRDGLTPENCNAVCQLLLPETQACAIVMTDTTHVLAVVGEMTSSTYVGAPNSGTTLEVLRSGRMETFSAKDLSSKASRPQTGAADDVQNAQNAQPTPPAQPAQPAEGNGPHSARDTYAAGIIAPLVVSEKPVGTLELYYKGARQIDRTQLKIASGLADLLSTQLTAYELDLQAELTAKAEVKALQAQINPHFLFNTLNTIASFTRTDPSKARDLLRQFSVFYRRTLESSESLIPLTQELEQTRRYLSIEKARFGEDRIIESEHVGPALGSIMVPSFLVQPIVENSVRHAMRDDGPLHIDIHVALDGDDVLVAVADDGLGMEPEVADALLEPQPIHKDNGQGRGTGIALRNVSERVERFFGAGSGLEILSKVDEGTCVTLRLAGAAPKVDAQAKDLLG
ncbi:MAG: sensor histidine kinase [Atopobiaceae bacterium]|jgi:two-component system sensor histidine kinase LytS